MARIEPYLGRLYRYAFSLCRDEDAARDLVQQCAVKALSARSVPKDEVAYRSWLFVILRNTLFDDARRRKSAEAMHEAVSERENRSSMELLSGDERLINTLSVKQAMAKLGENDRDIIGLIDLAGLSYAEAAGVLDVPVGTVMSRVSRARNRLIALLEPSNVTPISARRQIR